MNATGSDCKPTIVNNKHFDYTNSTNWNQIRTQFRNNYTTDALYKYNEQLVERDFWNVVGFWNMF